MVHIMVNKLSVGCWALIAISGQHFGYITEEEAPPAL